MGPKLNKYWRQAADESLWAKKEVKVVEAPPPNLPAQTLTQREDKIIEEEEIDEQVVDEEITENDSEGQEQPISFSGMTSSSDDESSSDEIFTATTEKKQASKLNLQAEAAKARQAKRLQEKEEAALISELIRQSKKEEKELLGGTNVNVNGSGKAKHNSYNSNSSSTTPRLHASAGPAKSRLAISAAGDRDRDRDRDKDKGKSSDPSTAAAAAAAAASKAITTVARPKQLSEAYCSAAKCGKLVSGVCSRCGLVSYCSRSCQATHWRDVHRLQCSGNVKREKFPANAADNAAAHERAPFARDVPVTPAASSDSENAGRSVRGAEAEAVQAPATEAALRGVAAAADSDASASEVNAIYAETLHAPNDPCRISSNVDIDVDTDSDSSSGSEESSDAFDSASDEENDVSDGNDMIDGNGAYETDAAEFNLSEENTGDMQRRRQKQQQPDASLLALVLKRIADLELEISNNSESETRYVQQLSHEEAENDRRKNNAALFAEMKLSLDAKHQQAKRNQELLAWAMADGNNHTGSKALASQYHFRANAAHDKTQAAVRHHFGAGGGGSHYHMAGSKQFQKGLRLDGVVSRHSKQAAVRNGKKSKARKQKSATSLGMLGSA